MDDKPARVEPDDRLWNYARALELAEQRIAETNGETVEEVRKVTGTPVSAARTYAEKVALVGMRLQVALTFGTSPEDLDRNRGGVRLLLESVKQLHGIVGLRA